MLGKTALSVNKQNMAVLPNLKNILAHRCLGFRPFVIILVPLFGPFVTVLMNRVEALAGEPAVAQITPSADKSCFIK